MDCKKQINSECTHFSLRGTNITLPHRYKFKPFHQSKQKLIPQISGSPKLFIQKNNNIPLKVCNDFPKQLSQKVERSKQHRSNNLINGEIQNSKSNIRQKIQFRIKQHTKFRRCTCGKCEDCMKDFGYYLHLMTSQDQMIPQISAKSWCIWRKRPNGNYCYYYGKRVHKVREVASLSKMLTAIVMMDELQRWNISVNQLQFQVHRNATVIGGTSANLIVGDIKNMLQLLYGMMLPSGNDAAITISQAIGLLIHLKMKNKMINIRNKNWWQPYINKNYSHLFINMMNEKCQKLGLLDTKIYNSHGNDAYEQNKNISTCNELARISSQFMTYSLLREVVTTKIYNSYENTNKLLEAGFDGIKTGITQTAGPCFAAAYKNIIIIVLNSKSMNQRWIEVKKLVKWIIKKS